MDASWSKLVGVQVQDGGAVRAWEWDLGGEGTSNIGVAYAEERGAGSCVDSAAEEEHMPVLLAIGE
eukprot:1593827-Rhodomonas_salina.5